MLKLHETQDEGEISKFLTLLVFSSMKMPDGKDFIKNTLLSLSSKFVGKSTSVLGMFGLQLGKEKSNGKWTKMYHSMENIILQLGWKQP